MPTLSVVKGLKDIRTRPLYFIRNYKIKKKKSIRFLPPKKDIEKDAPKKVPSLGERGLRGAENKGCYDTLTPTLSHQGRGRTG
jgi:hypothetical protein